MSRISFSVVPEDYETLKIEFLSLKKHLDDVNQELHNSKRNLKIIEALQNDYQGEIDMLQNEEIRQKQKYQEQILNLEDTINKMRAAHSEKIIALETDIMKLEEKNEYLEAEVDVLRKSHNDMSFGEDTSKLIEEILTLKEENTGFTENHEQLLVDLKQFQEKNMELQRCLADSKEENEQLKQSLDCKKHELTEATSLIEKLHDEEACLKSELDSYKNKPLDFDSKGNSLFAEVNDRRVHLQDTLKKMKVEYLEIKKEKATDLNTMKNLRSELARVTNLWKTQVEEKKEDQYQEVHALEGKVIVLEEMLDKYRKKIDSKPVVLYNNNYDEIKYFETVLKNKNEEIRDLENELIAKTSTRLMLTTSLREANEEKRRWQMTAMELQHQIESMELKRKIVTNEEATSSDSPDSPPSKDDIEKVMDGSPRKATGGGVGNIAERLSNVTIRRSGSARGSVSNKPAGILKELRRENHETDEVEIVGQRAPEDGVGKIPSGKENTTDDEVRVKPRKKATFSEDTVSPKKTVGTGATAGRRFLKSNPVFFKCPDPK